MELQNNWSSFQSYLSVMCTIHTTRQQTAHTYIHRSQDCFCSTPRTHTYVHTWWCTSCGPNVPRASQFLPGWKIRFVSFGVGENILCAHANVCIMYVRMYCMYICLNTYMHVHKYIPHALYVLYVLYTLYVLYVPQCVGVFNQLQKRRQEYIRDVLGYICDVPQFL